MKNISLLFIVVLLLTACAPPVPQATRTPDPTNTPAQTSTPTLTSTITPTITITPTVTETLTPTDTLTPTPLPAATMQAYRMMIMIQFEVATVDDTAKRVNSGELQGIQSLGAVLGVAYFIDGVDKIGLLTT